MFLVDNTVPQLVCTFSIKPESGWENAVLSTVQGGINFKESSSKSPNRLDKDSGSLRTTFRTVSRLSTSAARRSASSLAS